MPTSSDQQAHDNQVEEAASLAREHRHATAEHLLRQYVLGGMAVGFVPLPLVDLAALLGLQLKMLHSLAGVYDIEFKADLGRSAVASLLGSALPASLSPTVAASLGKFIPGIGQTLSTGSAVLLNGAATYAVGKVFIQHFAAGGTFLTFDPEAVRDYFLSQLQEGTKVSADLRNEKH
jgi:uncharacterized protein (DUF697 family)